MNRIEVHMGGKKIKCDFRKVSATILGLRNLPQIVESGGNIQSMLPALHSAVKSYRVIHKQIRFKGRGDKLFCTKTSSKQDRRYLEPNFTDLQQL